MCPIDFLISSFNFKPEMHLYGCLCDIVTPLKKQKPSPWDVPPVSPLRTPKLQQTSLSTHANRRLNSPGCRRDHGRSVDTAAAWKSSAASRWWTTWSERQHPPWVRTPGIYPPLYGIRTSSTMVNSTPVKAAVRTQMCFPEKPFKVSCNIVARPAQRGFWFKKRATKC